MSSEIRTAIESIATFCAEKRFDDAEQLCRKILVEFPENAEILKLLGVILCKKGKPERALSFLQKALTLKPDAADIMNLIAIAFAELGRYDDAEEFYNKALSINPEYSEAFYNLANLKMAKMDYKTALVFYNKAIILKPDYFSAYINRGNAFKKLNKFKEALESYKTALQMNPDSYEAHINAGTALQGLFLFDKAIEEYKKAAELNPGSPDPYKNMGDSYKNLLRLDAAVDFYNKAIQLNPGDADAHMFSGMTLLLQGKLKEGFQEYEWRLKRPEFSRLKTDFPRWDGGTVPDKTILVIAEQGFGDSIQFVRYLPIVKRYCGKLVLICQAPLIPLIEKQGLADVILPIGTRYEDIKFDFQIPLMSLPFALGTTIDSIPADLPYIKADPEKVLIWRDKLKDIKCRKIGVCWSGSPTNTNDFNRSMPFSEIEKLFSLPGIEFFNLQKKIDSQILTERANFRNFSDELKDFSDTAALVDNMDMVISVDTVMAHLAGAIGKETALLLPYAPEWRWLTTRSDSPWYPGILKIYRQPSYGNWAAVIESLKTELSR